MKNFINYLSKKSLSLGNDSGMTRKWFGNDSGMTRFSLASLICLCMLTIGVGNAWADKWVKVTSAPASWAGEYLLVYENNSTTGYVWTGVDAASCYTSATISNGEIASKPASAVSITIAAVTGGYSIQVNGGTNNGKYIYGTKGSNTINFNASAGVNTISYSSSSSDIMSNTSHMRWNSNRFRYYQSGSYSNYSPVQLYKKAVAVAYTVTFTKTDGSTEEIEEASVGAGVTPPDMSTPCDGWAFQGWSKSQSTSSTSTTVLTKEPLTTGKYYPSANTTLYPVYTKSGGTVFSQYQLITSASGDLSGKYLLSTGSITATGAVVSNNALPYESLTPGTTQYAAKEFTIVKNGNNSNYFIKFPNGYYLGNKKNSADLKTNGSTSAPTTDVNHFLWTFTTSEISNVNNSTRDLKYNNTLATPAIKSYAHTGNTYPKLKLYKRIETEITYYYSYPDCSSASQVVTPTFSLSAGTYIGTQSVSISCATDDATIYYTTNGSDPTTSSSVYSSALSISETTTLKAMAVADGLEDSEIASATYTIRPSKTYNLVTDASSLGIGDKIVILENGGTYAMSTTQNSNNRGASTDFVLSGSTVRVPDEGTVQPIALEAYADGYWYFNVGTDSYLAATGSSSSLLKTQTKALVNTNTTGKWSIALASSTFTVKTNDGPSYNRMRYNPNGGNPIFTCYSSDTQTAVKVYVYSNTLPTIQTNPTSLSGFSATYGGSASDAQNVYVSGRNLTGNITVTPPTGYEIKKSSDGSYSNSAITLSPSNGKVSVTLNVRLAAGNNAGNYNGNLTLVGYNSEASTNVALTGTVAKITPVITFTLSESAAMANTAVSYTLSSTSDATPITFSYVRGGSSVSSMITNDTENKTISISEAGVYKIRVNQAADANHNAAAQVERELTITVRDVFKDLVNGYDDVNGDDTGSGITTPTFSQLENGSQNACHSTTRYLIGWIKSTDLATIYGSPGESGYLEDAEAYDPDKVVAPGAAATASGITWYAVWAEEE